MPQPPQDEPDRKLRGRLARAAGPLLAVALLATPAPAEEIEGRAILAWRQFEDELRSDDGLTQDYSLWFRRTVSEALRFRVFFSADFADNNFDLEGASTSTRAREYRGSGDLHIFYPKLQLQTTYEGFDSSFENGVSGDRVLERGTLRLAWQPDGLPDFNLWADRREVRDDLRGEEQTGTLLQGSVLQAFGPWNLQGTIERTELDDTLGTVRSMDALRADIGYRDTHLDGRLSTSGRLFVTDSTTDERGRALSTVPGQRIAVLSAGTVVDPTPEDARDVVLSDSPGLIDGQFRTLGIDLGPSGQSSLNVVTDLGRLVDVERIRLHVRDLSGNRVPTGGPLDWNAYTSLDGLDWVRIPGATVFYDAAQSLYEVVLPATSTRLLKAVSFGLNIVETDLVEVEVFEASRLVPGERRETDRELARFEGRISASPAEWTTISWNGRFNSSSRTPQGGRTEEVDDGYQLFSFLVEPARWTDVLLRYQLQDQRQEAFQRDFDQWLLDVRFRPRPGVDLRVEALTGTDVNRDRRTETDGMALKAHTKLWRAIDLRFDVGEQDRKQRLPEPVSSTRRFANAWTIVQLTDSIQVTGTLTASRVETEGQIANGNGLPLLRDDDRWWVEAYWRPGPPLSLSARVGRASGDAFSTDLRRYQIQWNPFRAGALALTTVYDEDVDTSLDRTFRRLLVTTRWRINPRAALSASYTRLKLRELGMYGETTSLLMNLTMVL